VIVNPSTELIMNHPCKHPEVIRPPEGRYANYFQVGCNPFEFVFDFGQFYAESQPPHIHTRIIVSAVYVKSLLETLMESIKHYEQDWETIAQGEGGKAEEK
jgi:hypothetical protein